ncbi:MAG TPA: hydroxysqualene dehydroxylase HpnE [Gaiellaceae bacterium]|nr:hydroxysqualene dehydroxylase HpnE [Gaiellaceae bacterium]
MSSRRIAVVGGGLAGLAAALECADAGATVTLFESRSRLGGATFSVQRHGYWLDNGQHVALRCCTAYRSFLRRLGVDHLLELQPRLRIPVLSPDGPASTLERNSLPAPFHLTSTLLRYGHLSLRERLMASRAALALRSLDPTDPELDRQAFGHWLRAHGQSERAVAALWNLIALPTLNLSADDASLALAVKVFRTGLLDESDACDIGVPSVPLQQLHADPAAAALTSLGARIETSAAVRRIDRTDDGLKVHLRDTEEPADAVIVAVPHDSAAQLLPEGTLDPQALEGLGASPIVNVHLHYDRPVLDQPFAAAVDSPVQWVFDRTAASGVEEGQFICISISGADAEIGQPEEELRERYVGALARLLPAAGNAQLLDGFVTRQPRATFRGIPGTQVLRPGAHTSVEGLYVAGAWTDTGWPATMEGAVRSGVAAARAALAQRPASAVADAKRLEPVA